MSTKSCLECGAACKSVADGSYVCAYCGATFTEEDFAPKRPAKETAASAPAAPAHPSSEDIYENSKNGVVEIRTDTSAASGFIISAKGLVLTNAHAVVEDNNRVANNIYVKIGESFVRAHVIALGDTDTGNPKSADLALLALEGMPHDAKSLSLGDSSAVKIGQHVYYIGNSKGEGICMTGGIVSDNNRKVNQRYYLMTDAATNPGNSGGPLFNEDGKVIGVHVSARNEAVGMKYAIPINTAYAFLNRVEDKLDVRHNTLADDISPSQQTTESAAVFSLVLAGVTLLVENIKFIQSIISTIRGK